MEVTVGQIAGIIDGTVEGDAGISISRVIRIDDLIYTPPVPMW